MELCPIHKCLPVVGKHIFVPASKVTTYTGKVVEVPEHATRSLVAAILHSHLSQLLSRTGTKLVRDMQGVQSKPH